MIPAYAPARFDGFVLWHLLASPARKNNSFASIHQFDFRRQVRRGFHPTFILLGFIHNIFINSFI